MSRRVVLTALALMCMAGLVSACEPRRADEPTSSATATGAPNPAVDRLLGTKWVLLDIARVPALPDYPATMEFSSLERFAGNASCNTFGGTVEISEGRMRVRELQQTLKACAPPILDQETRYLAALQAAERYEFAGEELRIWFAGSDRPLRFRPSMD